MNVKRVPTAVFLIGRTASALAIVTAVLMLMEDTAACRDTRDCIGISDRLGHIVQTGGDRRIARRVH